MSNWPTASVFRRHPACAGSVRWRKRATSRAIGACWIRAGSVSTSPCLPRGTCPARRMRVCVRCSGGWLDPRGLGCAVTVFASVHLSSQADADLRAFEDFVRAEPLVRECWMLSGEVDFILKCVAPDMATFQDFVTHLTAAPHVRNVRTSLVLHNSKYEAAVPLEVKAVN